MLKWLKMHKQLLLLSRNHRVFQEVGLKREKSAAPTTGRSQLDLFISNEQPVKNSIFN